MRPRLDRRRDVGLDVRLTGAWLRDHPRITMIVAIAMFGVVLGLRWAIPEPAEGFALLLLLPVALLGLSFGRVGGILGAAAGMALFGFWNVVLNLSHVDTVGWLMRATVIIGIGSLPLP